MFSAEKISVWYGIFRGHVFVMIIMLFCVLGPFCPLMLLKMFLCQLLFLYHAYVFIFIFSRFFKDVHFVGRKIFSPGEGRNGKVKNTL